MIKQKIRHCESLTSKMSRTKQSLFLGIASSPSGRLRFASLSGFALLAMTIGITLLFNVAVLFAQDERFFELKAKKFSYTPNIIKVNKGDLVRIRLVSEDVHHGFFLDGYGAKMSAYPGQEGSVKFTADKPGRFSFRCSVTCGEFHPYMVGYLVVEPNTRFNVYAFLTLIVGIGSIILIARRREE